MDYAVILTGGKQYRVSEGDEILVEKLPQDSGKKVTFDHVLLIRKDDEVLLGQQLEKARVEAEVLSHLKSPKVKIAKFKSKSRYRRKTGHRQPITKVKVIQINVK